jgi:hypothetical protein
MYNYNKEEFQKVVDLKQIKPIGDTAEFGRAQV